MNPDAAPNSIVGLLHTLRDETTTLLRQEVALAQAELSNNLSKAGKNAAALAAGGFVAYAGVIVLLIGLGQLLGVVLVRSGIDPAVSQWLAPSIVGLVVALIGWGMVAKAKRAFKPETIAPRKTIDSLKTNKEWAQTKLQPSHEART